MSGLRFERTESCWRMLGQEIAGTRRLDLQMVFFLHPGAEYLLKELPKDRNFGSKDVMVLTSYLPAYKREPHSGIEKLKQLRLEKNQRPAILLSFEACESLLRTPDNQILDEVGTYHLCLPFSLSQFESLLGSLEPISTDNIDKLVRRSCTLHGQLDSFLTRLLKDLQKAPVSVTLTSLKLENLQKFCARNWGNWFENPVRQAQDCVRHDNFDCAAVALRAMREQLSSVIICRAFQKFSHGGNADIVNRGLGPLRAMLVGFNGGSTKLVDLENYVSSSKGLQDLLRKMLSLSNELETLLRPFLQVPDDLKDQATRFVAALRILLNNGAINFTHTNANSLMDAIDTLVTVTDKIIQKGNRQERIFHSGRNSKQTNGRRIRNTLH